MKTHACYHLHSCPLLVVQVRLLERLSWKTLWIQFPFYFSWNFRLSCGEKKLLIKKVSFDWFVFLILKNFFKKKKKTMPKFILLWTRHIFLLNTIKVFHHMSLSIVSVKIDHFHFLSSLSHYYTYNLQDKVDFLISNAFFILVVQKKSAKTSNLFL